MFENLKPNEVSLLIWSGMLVTGWVATLILKVVDQQRDSKK